MKPLFMSGLLAAALAVCAGSALAEDRPASKAPATDASRPGTLSDKLSETGGLITPSGNVDPGIHKSAPAPRPNSTPVIKPPGTGGKPGPTPK